MANNYRRQSAGRDNDPTTRNQKDQTIIESNIDMNNYDDDPLNSLTTHQITQLATLLRLPASNESTTITTSHMGWLTHQEEQIKENLDPALKESSADKQRRRLRLPTPAFKSSTLCSAHKGLRPDLIASAFQQLRELWEGGLVQWEGLLYWFATRDNLGPGVAVTEPPRAEGRGREGLITMLRTEVEGFIKAIVGVSALAIPEDDLRGRFDQTYFDHSGSATGAESEATSGWGVDVGKRNVDGDNSLFAGPDNMSSTYRYISTGC